MRKMVVTTILFTFGLFISTFTVSASEIKTKNELTNMMLYGSGKKKTFLPAKPSPYFLEKTTIKSSKTRKYKFIKITDCDEGYFPSINNLDEIYYEKYDENGNPNVYSNEHGWLTESATGNLRYPDVNDNGEIVYSDFQEEHDSFQIFSNLRGLISQKGNTPSINNIGEIVYSVVNNSSSIIISTERGEIFSSMYAKNPEINDNGEILYQDLDSNGIGQIYSNKRGKITAYKEEVDAGTPTFGKNGEIFYVARDINGINQLFSSKYGQITDSSSFPEPNYNGPWTGDEKFGLYANGIGYYPDANNNGKVVFGRVLVEGPYCEMIEESKECYGIASVQLYMAEPTEENEVPVEENVVEVEIDIVPGSERNCVDINGFGYIPVALLGSDSFKVEEVNIETVALEGENIAKSKYSHKFLSWQKDINKDGFDDLFLLFHEGDMSIKTSERIILTGMLKNTMLFEGSDIINDCID